MEPTIRHQDTSTLGDYLRVAWHRKWAIALPLVAIPLTALLLALRQDRVYEASASVFLNQQNLAATVSGIPDYSLFQDRSAYVQTQITLAGAPIVVSRVAKAARIAGPDALAGTSVQPSAGNDLLIFTVSSRRPALAVRLANEYARQFALYRHQLDTGAIDKARKELATQIAELRRQGQRSASYRSLLDKQNQLVTLGALQGANAFVFRRAAHGIQVQPRPKRAVALGLALGLLFGVALAFLWHALDTRVRSTDELSDRLALPLLARIPEPAKRSRRSGSMVAEPSSVQAEAFRVLKTNLEFVNLDRQARSIMFTSAVESEGKSTTVANLAVAFARGGTRVLLIDLDLRRPMLDRFFALEGHAGLTDVALGHANLEEAIQVVSATSGPNGRPDGNGNHAHGDLGGVLEVLTAGPAPPNPGEFVSSRVLGDILDASAARADLVLIDAPPLLHVGDGLALSAKVDALVVITRLKVIRRPTIRELKRVLDTAPTAKLGFVLTGADADGGYGYGGSYYYAGRPQRGAKEPVG